MNFASLIHLLTKFIKTMTAEQNKALVRRVNKEFIEGGNMNTFNEIFAEDFVNHTAPPGSPKNRDGVVYFFNHLLKPAFPDLKVEIHDMVAEGDKVTKRKSFHATHKGEFFGVLPTNKSVIMEVIDIIELRNGKYIGHWGILDLHSLMAQLNS
jgi:predicted ester cyclase